MLKYKIEKKLILKKSKKTNLSQYGLIIKTYSSDHEIEITPKKVKQKQITKPIS